MTLPSQPAVRFALFLILALNVSGSALLADPASIPPSSTTPTTPGTVAPTQSKVPETIDDKAPGWTWKGMIELDDDNMFKGSGHVGGPGTYADYTFSGTGVQVYGLAAPTIVVDSHSHSMGSASAWIDGKLAGTNSVNNKDTLYRFIVFKVDGFPEGSHILHLEPVGGWIDIDYIKTLHTPPPPPETQTAQGGQGANLGPVYRLIPHNGEKFCLGAGGDGSLNGATLMLNLPRQSTRQMWHLKPIGNNQYSINPVDDPSEAVWIVPPSPAPENATTQALLAPFTNRPNQELILTQVSNGWYRISSANDESIFLTVANSPIGEGTWVIGDRASGQTSQEWYLQPVTN